MYEEFHPFSRRKGDSHNAFYPEVESRLARSPSDLDSSQGFLILWGGSDISPSLDSRPSNGAYQSKTRSPRDLKEESLFNKAVEIGLPIVGVCRGAQLGCALSGGILIQHVDGHHHDHTIETKEGDTLITSSLHHQMMYPWNIDHILYAWTVQLSSRYIGITTEELRKIPVTQYGHIEPEIVWFPKTKTLAIQGHPEYMRCDHLFNIYIKNLIDKLCLH